MYFSVWVAVVEAWNLLIESSHFSDEEIERGRLPVDLSGSPRGSLSINKQVSLLLRILFWSPIHLIHSLPHTLKFLYFFQKELGQRYWFWGRWVFTEPLSTLPVGWLVLVIPSGKEQNLSLSISPVIFRSFSQVESWNNNLIYFINRCR